MPKLSPISAAIDRRAALGLIGGGIGVLALVACGGGGGLDSSTESGTDSGSSGSSGSGSCSEIPEETNGPFPADGSQSGVTNVLDDARVIRSDIVSSFGGGDTQTGIALTLTITVEDVGNSCAALEGAAVYVWHCNADGEYSVYSGNNNGNHSGQTFLRGAQVTDGSGQVTFTTIYPGRYAGRATHIHVEVYSDDSFATLLKTSQFAFDEDINAAVYATSSYSDSAATQATSNDDDNVFGDGYELELLSFSGSASAGYTAAIAMGVVAT